MIYRLHNYPLQVGPLTLTVDGIANLDRVGASNGVDVVVSAVEITAVYDGYDELARGSFLQRVAEDVAVITLNHDNRNNATLDKWYAENTI